MALKAKASTDENVDGKIDVLTQTAAALKANTIGIQITARKRDYRVLEQALHAADALLSFDVATHNETLSRRANLAADYETFRGELFAAADLPVDPDDTWGEFIEAGEQYRQHLTALGAHDADRCLYCRQPLTDTARALLTKYSTYLADKISADIRGADAALANLRDHIAAVEKGEVGGFIEEFDDRDDRPGFFADVKLIEETRAGLSAAVGAGSSVELDFATAVTDAKARVGAALTASANDIAALETQAQNRTDALAERQGELLELKDSAELAKSWPAIETQVKNAQQADQLRTLKRPLQQLARAVTELAKTASDGLINQSFDALFLEECEELRAPALKLQFVGREGKAQRRKVLNGRHKPSKVLSEGEQKVLALADFLAEAWLAGINAPVIFDDPLSSLDHRRVSEVARRVAGLAGDNQVIVFTHDILFATTLLALFEKSKRCVYFHVTDEDGRERSRARPGLAGTR